MLNNKSFLCLMLARGGSKGLPNKNIKPILGRPLIYYTINAVQKAGFFDRFILSTDSTEIADTARKYGVEVPFMRPDKLASDNASALDAIVHALKWIEENENRTYDYVLYIFPTAPLRNEQDIRNSADILLKKEAEMVISVCETEHPAVWSNTLKPDHSMKNFIKKEFRNTNRQNLPPTYRINGAVYLAKWDVFYHRKDWFEQDTYAYVMPPERSIDIDTILDFNLAKLLMKENGYG